MALQVETIGDVWVITIGGPLGRRIPDALSVTLEHLPLAVKKLVIQLARDAADSAAFEALIRSAPLLKSREIRSKWIFPSGTLLEQKLVLAGVAELFQRSSTVSEALRQFA